ncbi:hypothetical protein ACPOL_6742 (plasmid) [Acidisarcina polymorpha]|uniref:Uncharacterized protein n=1 Tax=Acidisarcina polymorpha TaxID=2211140 RepID=A0A2Z5G9I8_9BACT|nr:hypothetical protein ACPOL_6742 [Acidisarcina polymorpha]
MEIPSKGCRGPSISQTVRVVSSSQVFEAQENQLNSFD